MTENQKKNSINAMLEKKEDDSKLSVYLTLAKDAILNKMYPYDRPQGIEEVPSKYEHVQIQAVIVGLTVAGAEGQNSHSENGIGRSFNYPTMIEYVNTHVVSVVGTL